MFDFSYIQKELDYYQKFIPLNYESEKDAFFQKQKKGIPYNPVFEYQDPLTVKNYHEIRVFLVNSKGADRIINHFLDRYVLVTDLMIAWKEDNYPGMTQLSGTLFGSYCQLDLPKAVERYKRVVSLDHSTQENLYCDEEIGCFFLKYFSQMGLSGWSIEYPITSGSEVSIYELEKKVVIRKGTVAGQAGLERIICHEIVGHAFQAFNAMETGHPYTDWLTTYLGTETQYEGWAVFTEVNNLKQHHIIPIIRRYLFFMIATAMASELSFDKVYSRLFELSSDQEFSFFAAAKAKRGFSDTSVHGCFQKENSYLTGALMVIDLVRKNLENLNKLSLGVFPFTALNDIQAQDEPAWASVKQVNHANIEFFINTLNGCIDV